MEGHNICCDSSDAGPQHVETVLMEGHNILVEMELTVFHSLCQNDVSSAWLELTSF